jgi:hypothetical protein
MKFGRLLAAGRSMHPGHQAGRYQMSSGMALPQFISPKNPFKAEAATRAAAKPALETAIPLAAKRVEKISIKPPVKLARLVAEGVGRLKILLRGWLPKVWAVGGARLKRVGEFCLDHNPFSAIGRPRLPGIPRFGRATVQGELSLDRVRVVRNDLAQADLEVVRLGGVK